MAQRFHDWAHTHVVGGDRAAAAPYVAEARKLLGMVTEDAANNGLETHQMTRRFQDGALIAAEIRGSIPRMTIAPPGAGDEKLDPRVPDNFVIRLRDENLPDGIDPEVPETMERVDGGQWRTLFHSTTTPGYDGFPGKKGTYRYDAGADVFPDGINHAGNIDWRGDDGLRVSWYGPSTRYFFDPYVMPRSQFGEFVFMLGQVLLDVEQYIADSAPEPEFDHRWVMGAALRGRTELLVVHALLPVPTWPTGSAPAGDRRMEMPWPVAPVSIEICRYALAPRDDKAPYLEVIAGSRMVLATTTLDNAFNPWFFNASATAAIACCLPDNVFAIRDTASDGVMAPEPSTSSLIATALIDEDTASVATTAVSLTPDGEATLACDFRGDELVELVALRERNAAGYDVRSLRVGSTQVRLRDVYDPRDIDGRPGSTYDQYHLLWADLRDGVMVLNHARRWIRLNAPSPTLFRRVEVHQNGGVLYAHPLNMRTEYDAEWTGLSRLAGAHTPEAEDLDHNPMRSAAMAPAQVLYEIMDWSPDVDFRTYWQGSHGNYINLAYPVAEYFGSLVEGREASGNPYVELSAVAANQAQYNNEQRDVHGHCSVLGCATSDGTTVFSGYHVNVGGYTEDAHSTTFAAPFRPGFPMLGGVQQRCNPVWLLGNLPQSLAA